MPAFFPNRAGQIQHAAEELPYTTEELARLSSSKVNIVSRAARAGEIPGAEREDGRWIFRDRAVGRAWAALRRMSAHRRTIGGRATKR